MAEDNSMDPPAKPQAAPRRKFAIEPVETTSRSSKEEREAQKEKEKAEAKPRRKFLPQPVEESSRSTRHSETNGDRDVEKGQRNTGAQPNGSAERKPRKFAPQPVETVKRARRRNTGNALQPGDGTDDSPGDSISLPRHLRPGLLGQAPPPPSNSPSPFADGVSPPPVRSSSPYTEGVPESRFSYANLARKNSRQSSMRRPSLEPISSVPESEESNLSKRSSPSTSTSIHEDEQRGLKPTRPRRAMRESYDDVFQGYLLDMAARQAQQQLIQQAAAAYPNERLHDPVDHFAVDRESSSDTEQAEQDGIPQIIADDLQRNDPMRPSAWGEKDALKPQNALNDQTKQQQQQQQKGPTSPGTQRRDPFASPFNMQGISGLPAADRQPEVKRPHPGARPPVQDRDPELKRIRNVARPPMLGGSIVFPKCPSPSATLIDPHQVHGTRKNTTVKSREPSGLWSPGNMSPIKKVLSPKASLCLWGGSCTAEQAQRTISVCNPSMQTGILTPITAPDENPLERWDKDEQLRTQVQSQHQLPSKPTSRVTSVVGIDQLLAIEVRLEEEYPDEFVTQIYNYLSLGYPGIARDFDEELSKISKMSVEEIRRDDSHKNTKGYIGAPEGISIDEDDAKIDCGRWKALRLYIREWARQQPFMMEDGNQDWGQRARRGSWFA